MVEKKEENKPATYPSVEEKIKMKVEKEKTHYTEFEIFPTRMRSYLMDGRWQNNKWRI